MCRTGCPTQDHESYAACLKDTGFHIGDLKGTSRAWDRNLDTYESVRRDGIQPKSCDPKDIATAVRKSKK